MAKSDIKYEITYLPLKSLSVVWAEAQRPFNPKRAQEIADNFDLDLLDPLKVTRPNGEGIYHICDGQTRKAAIEIWLGGEDIADQRVPCHVSSEGDPVRAAQIFLKTNTGRRPPSNVDNFKVSVTAQLPNEVAINKIVQHHGYRIDSHPSESGISAVGALRFVYTVCGPTILDKTLRLIRDVWAEDRNAVVGPIVRGFGVFLNEFGRDIDYAKFVTVLKKWTPGTLQRDAKNVRDVHGSITTAMVQVMRENYNKVRGVKPLKRKEQRKEPPAK